MYLCCINKIRQYRICLICFQCVYRKRNTKLWLIFTVPIYTSIIMVTCYFKIIYSALIIVFQFCVMCKLSWRHKSSDEWISFDSLLKRKRGKYSTWFIYAVNHISGVKCLLFKEINSTDGRREGARCFHFYASCYSPLHLLWIWATKCPYQQDLYLISVIRNSHVDKEKI